MLFGNAFPEDDDRGDDEPPTPGERVLYALGQLHRLHRRRRFPFHPEAFDIQDLASVLGVAGSLEFETSDRYGRYYHFASEVLIAEPEQPFPWRLLTVWEWAAEQHLNDSWREGRD